MKKVRRHVYLSAQQIKRLELLRDNTGASISELIRRAILEYLEREKKRWAE